MALSPIFKKMLIGRSFETDRGRVKMFENLEFTLFPSRALTLNLQKIGEKLGNKHLFDFGYSTTIHFDKELTDTIRIQSRKGEETLTKLKPIIDVMGWGAFQYIKKEYSKNTHHFIIRTSNNPISYHAKKTFGSKSKVCFFLSGMYSAHTKTIFNVDVVFKETKCVAKGDPYCEFVSKR